NSLFNRWNIVLRNRAAEYVIYKFELSASRHRFHLDFAIAILTVAARLFFVTSLHVSLAANRLTVRNLGRLQHDFRVIALLHLETTTSMCCWPVPAIKNSLVCASRKKRSMKSSSINLWMPLESLSSSARVLGSMAKVMAG